jgi:NADH dehydrogenase FAD-containing subunit
VNVVEAANSILPGFSEQVKCRVLAEVAKKGIKLHLDHKILGVTPEAIRTSQGDVLLGRGGLAIWTCGVRPTAFARQFATPDGQLRAGGGDSSVFLIGDAARGRGPPTAQNAKRQGEYLAHFFNAGRPAQHPAYKFEELARVVDIGDKLVVGRDDFAVDVPGVARSVLYALLD